jgi:hypothetical protein
LDCKEPTERPGLCAGCTHALLAELAVPSNEPVTTLFVPFDVEDSPAGEYTLFIVGTPIDAVDDKPCWVWRDGDQDQSVLRVRSVRVYRDRTRAFIEQVWSEDAGLRTRMLGLEQPMPRWEMDRAAAGTALLQELKRGRPAGIVAYPDFPERLDDLLADWRETRDDAPTQRDLAEDMGLSLSQFKRYLRQHGITVRGGRRLS